MQISRTQHEYVIKSKIKQPKLYFGTLHNFECNLERKTLKYHKFEGMTECYLRYLKN